jgi:hypothetical protein
MAHPKEAPPSSVHEDGAGNVSREANRNHSKAQPVAQAAGHFVPSYKKARGRARASLDLISAMRDIAEETQPITGRGIGYKLFTAGLIDGMSAKNMRTVYRLLLAAREEGTIPWRWVVDETRELERTPQWDDPAEFVGVVARSYRRDFWKQQPEDCEVWSEKGTIRGVLKPVLDAYGVGFRVFHGFTSATSIHEIIGAAMDNDKPLNVIYVGDYDPSGMWMSERDLPARCERYSGSYLQINIERVAVTLEQARKHRLSSFPASDKRKDTRYQWFVERYGNECWELDAMDPRALRDCVEAAIQRNILDKNAWKRCELINEVEQESLRSVLDEWSAAR